MSFYRSLNYFKFPKVSRTLVSILTYFSNAIVWIVSILPLISSSSCHFFKLKSYYLNPHNPQLFQFSGKVQIFVSLFAFFYFHSAFRQMASSFWLLLLLIDSRYSLRISIWWPVFISKPQRILYLILLDWFWFGYIPLCIYHCLAQHYKAGIKSKVEQSWEWSNGLPYTSVW